MLSVLVVAMVAQFVTPRYNAFIYWLVVVLVSIVGTLVTDNLTDGLGVKTWISSIVFAVLLTVTFGGWYAKERSLDIHLIRTRRREAFYWVAILFTFSLGTAFGDFITEEEGLGYARGVGLFAGLIAASAIAKFFLNVNGVFCFWVAYILTRPLGACIGDGLTADPKEGGLGAGTTLISIIFLLVILAFVTGLYVMVYKQRIAAEKEFPAKDVPAETQQEEQGTDPEEP